MRRVLSAMLGSVVLAACGTSTHDATPTPRTQTPSPSATGGPCSSVTQTTLLQSVPLACQRLWAPYGVTKVPPPNELALEHVPPGPPVDNRTNGAASNADAQAWVDAGNRDSGWFQWAEANGQVAFLLHLNAESVFSQTERTAMDAGATIAQPACDLYPLAATLFPLGTDGRAYFGPGALSSNDLYVFVLRFPAGPCAATATYPDGHTVSIDEAAPGNTVFVPGQIIHDELLGDIWYSDGGGNCDDPKGPPPQWCGR